MKSNVLISTLLICFTLAYISHPLIAQPTPRLGMVTTNDAVAGREVSTEIIDADNSAQSIYAVANTPNPFNDLTTIEFRLPVRSFVTLTLNDQLGRFIGTMISENLEAGNHGIEFEAATLPSGTYTYTLDIGTTRIVRTMVKVE